MILLRIADQIGHHGENAWPGINTIARDCNISNRQVQKCISGLVELGELLVFPNAGGSKDCPADRRPNRYEMPLMDGWAPPRTISPKSDPFSYMKTVFVLNPAEPDGVNSTTPREVSPTTPRTDNGVNSRTQRGELQGSNGVSPTTPDMPLDPSMRKSSSACEAEKPDFSDWKPAAAIVQRIKMMRPGVTDEFLAEILPEFLTYAEGHYRKDQLDAKYLANANRQWFRSKNKPGPKGPPEELPALIEWVEANNAPGNRPGETTYYYRKRLFKWIDDGRPAIDSPQSAAPVLAGAGLLDDHLEDDMARLDPKQATG